MKKRDTNPTDPKTERKKPGPPPDPNKKKTHQILMTPGEYAYFTSFADEKAPGNDTRTMECFIEAAKNVMPAGPKFGNKERDEKTGRYLPADRDKVKNRPTRLELTKRIDELEKRIQELEKAREGGNDETR